MESIFGSFNMRILWICALVLISSLNPVDMNPNVLPLNRIQVLEYKRKEIKQLESDIRLGFTPNFNQEEVTVNSILMGLKSREVDQGLANSSYVLAGRHFFNVKPLIEQSPVFQFIKRMPKGAMLHGHNTAMVSSEWFIKNITYHPDIMMYRTAKNVIRFTFKHPDQPFTELRYIRDLRRAASDVQSFDNYLETLINLKTSRPELDYPDIDVVWSKFQKMFETVRDALRYYPVFIDYHYQMLQELADDNVMYGEIRSGFGDLYDSSGRTYTALETVKVLKSVVDSFKSRNPNFFGLKFIFAASRRQGSDHLAEEIREYKQIASAFPDFVVGFDVVGQEKAINSNANFATQIMDLPRGTKFFFHSGETNWLGSPMDDNVAEALLMNTTRLGHAFALLKHPVLWDTVKRKRIGVEVSPISNQVLHLVSDLRNHPAAFYLSINIPIVICSDDPGFWDVKGLSYDFYYAFMAFAPLSAGLETLKKLVWTSVEQSILTDAEWMEAQKTLQKQWNVFLLEIIRDYRQF